MSYNWSYEPSSKLLIESICPLVERRTFMTPSPTHQSWDIYWGSNVVPMLASGARTCTFQLSASFHSSWESAFQINYSVVKNHHFQKKTFRRSPDAKTTPQRPPLLCLLRNPCELRRQALEVLHQSDHLPAESRAASPSKHFKPIFNGLFRWFLLVFWCCLVFLWCFLFFFLGGLLGFLSRSSSRSLETAICRLASKGKPNLLSHKNRVLCHPQESKKENISLTGFVSSKSFIAAVLSSSKPLALSITAESRRSVSAVTCPRGAPAAELAELVELPGLLEAPGAGPMDAWQSKRRRKRIHQTSSFWCGIYFFLYLLDVSGWDCLDPWLRLFRFLLHKKQERWWGFETLRWQWHAG